MNNNLLKTKTYNQNDNQISTLISGQHKKTSQKKPALNIRVDDNARSLSLFSRSDVASTLFTTGLFRSNWPTDPLYTPHTVSQNREKFLRILHHQHVTDQDITTHTPFMVVSKNDS